MKNRFRDLLIALAWLAFVTLNSQLSNAFAQGSLTPPGAPAPTMKSLDQVEARAIVNAANTPGDANDLFNISLPGSYYLTTNLAGVSGKNGIEITTNNVTLDLNGFALQGVSGSSNGIWIPNASVNITLRNGSVSSWGVDGVSNTSSSAVNLVCERLNVSSSGADGICLNGSGVVRDCNTQNNNNGIICLGSGGVLISGCTANGNEIGINVGGANCTVENCTASANQKSGIVIENNNTVKDCIANANPLGIDVLGNYCQIAGNTCSGNSSIGIQIIGVQNRIDNNSVGNNTFFGIYPININVTNSITRNSAPGNGSGGYVHTTGNSDYAPIQTPSTATSPWANFQ